RIVGNILVILGVAFAVMITVTATSLFARIETQTVSELEHETEKFRAFIDQTVPAMDTPITADSILTLFLQENIAETHESFFSMMNGVPDRRSRNAPPVRLDQDPKFVDHI